MLSKVWVWVLLYSVEPSANLASPSPSPSPSSPPPSVSSKGHTHSRQSCPCPLLITVTTSTVFKHLYPCLDLLLHIYFVHQTLPQHVWPLGLRDQISKKQDGPIALSATTDRICIVCSAKTPRSPRCCCVDFS